MHWLQSPPPPELAYQFIYSSMVRSHLTPGGNSVKWDKIFHVQALFHLTSGKNMPQLYHQLTCVMDPMSWKMDVGL